MCTPLVPCRIDLPYPSELKIHCATMAFGKSGMEKNIELSFPPFHGVIPTHHSVPLHSTHIGISNSAATGPVQDRASQGDCDWSAVIQGCTKRLFPGCVNMG